MYSADHELDSVSSILTILDDYIDMWIIHALKWTIAQIYERCKLSLRTCQTGGISPRGSFTAEGEIATCVVCRLES